MPSIIEYVLKERGAWPVVPPELAEAQRRLMPYPVMNLLDRIGSEEALEHVWDEASPVPGWTYHDLLAHIATGDWVCQGILRRVTAGESPDGFAQHLDLDETNARLVAERRDASISALAYEYVSTRWETFDLMSRLTPEALRETVIDWDHRNSSRPEWGKLSLQEYLDGFWRHEDTHRGQLETALARREGPGGRA
jgi:hypothetical protein